MGIRIDGAADLISATDGSLTVEGESVNTTGIVTASGGFKVGTAATIYSNGNATFSGIITAGSHLYADQGHFTDHIYIADTICHTGDTNTKIRFPSADKISLETAGVERFRVDSSGMVGIGTDNPGQRLEVFDDDVALGSDGNIMVRGIGDGADKGGQITFGNKIGRRAAIAGNQETTGTTGYLLFGTRGSSGDITERMRIRSNGIIGIGTDGSASSAKLQLVEPDSTECYFHIANQTTGYDSNSGVLIGLNGSEELNILQMENNNLNLGTSGAERLTISGSGAILVGTDTPTYGSGDMQHEIKKDNTRTYNPGVMVGHSHLFLNNSSTASADTFCGLGFRAGTGDGAIGYVYNGSTNQADFVIITDGQSNGRERLRITDAGNVGIGTTIPTVEFQVQGGGTVADFRGTGGNSSIQISDVNNAKNLFLQNSDGVFNIQTSGSSYSNKFSVAENGKVTISDGDTFQYPKSLNVQGESGSIVALRNWETTSYAQDTNVGIDFNLLTGNTNNTNGSCEIRAFKENGTNGDNARGLNFWTSANGGSPTERMRINSAGHVSFAAGSGIHADAHVWIGGGQASGAGGGDGLSLHYSSSTSTPIYFNNETGYPQKSLYMESYWMKLRGHNNEGIEFLGSNASSAPDLLFKFEGKNGGGDCFNYQNSVDWDTTSDERIKTGVTTITGSDGLSKISQLRPVHFDYTDNWCYYKGWTHNSEDTGTVTGINTSLQKDNVGWIAQEYINVFPRDVKVKNTTIGLSTDHTEYAQCGVVTYSDFHTMSQNSVVPHLVAAIQELKTLNDALTARVATLESA